MIKILLLTIGLLSAYSGKSLTLNDEFILDNGTAGPFFKNMPIEKALELAQEKYTVKETTISLEGDDYLVYDIYLGSELLLKLEPTSKNDGKVWRIWIYSERYKTNKGIGVGSSVAEMLASYTFDYLQAEGSGRCLFVKEYNICFDLDSSAFPYEWYMNGAKFEDIPDDTKITLVIP